MTGIDSWSTTPATNATADGGSINWAEGQAPSTVNNTARQMLTDVRNMANDLIWFQYGTGDQGAGNIAVPGVYASGTSFTIAGVDVTAVYHANRRIKAVGSGTGTIYGSVSSSSFSSNTTVNVTWDSGSLSNETLTIYLSQVPVTGLPIPMEATAKYAKAVSWTPTLAFATVGDSLWSYGTQTGRYTRIGPFVKLDFNLDATPTFTTASGLLKIGGLPFAAASAGTLDSGILALVEGFTWPAGRTNLALTFNSSTGASALIVSSMGSVGISTTGFQASNMTSGAQHRLWGSILYLAA